jgi:glutamyl-tRNA reductase
VPRDVDAAVAQLENVFLYNIDDLQSVAAQAAAKRRDEIPAAERIVDEEVERFWGWVEGLGVVPAIKAFRGRMDAVREAELQRALRRMPHLTDADRAMVEQLSHALMNKFLHQPTIALKRAAEAGNGDALLLALRALFERESDE